jgi:hypothetical protein
MAEQKHTSRWQIIAAEDWESLPEKAGVYTVAYLCYNRHGRLENDHFYVGSTSNLKHRFRCHVNSPTGLLHKDHYGSCSGHEIHFSLSSRYGDWAMRELRLIRRLQPSANIKNLGVANGK